MSFGALAFSCDPSVSPLASNLYRTFPGRPGRRVTGGPFSTSDSCRRRRRPPRGDEQQDPEHLPSIVAKRKSLDLGQPRNVKDRGAFMVQGGEDLRCDKTAKSTRSGCSILDNLGR